MPKLTGSQQYGQSIPVNLSVDFERGRSVSRAPFVGIDIPKMTKAMAVQNGAPDGASAWPQIRINSRVQP
jgi:hypothetical protein